MVSKKVEVLIFKYLNKTATGKDLSMLSDWVAENEEEFVSYVRTNTLINGSFESSNIKKAKNALLAQVKIDRNTGRKNRVATSLKYAAVFIGVIGLIYFFGDRFFDNGISRTKSSDENITLKLGSGALEVISNKTEKLITNEKGEAVATQKGNKLVYNSSFTDENAVFNELKVPYGKRFELILSDKTKVYLNAGSTLRYPTHFMEQGPREVFLTGEAYFSVTKNQKKSFVVNAGQIDIEVLGTEFNVSIYPEDSAINTVLVEGAVKVSRSGDTSQPFLLKPNQMASYNKEKHIMKLMEVDIDMYTAWKDGILLFRNTPFSSIKKKLERHFNISIINGYKFLDNQVYTASFYKEENIEQILKVFKEDTPFEYRIRNSELFISEPSDESKNEKSL